MRPLSVRGPTVTEGEGHILRLACKKIEKFFLRRVLKFGSYRGLSAQDFFNYRLEIPIHLAGG